MKPRPTDMQSARLKLGEFIGLADRLQHGSRLLRQEAQNLLEDVFEDLDSQIADTPSQCGDAAPATEAALDQARQDLAKEWLEVDHALGELVGQAADEIYQFVTTAESRIDKLDRQARYELHRTQLLETYRSLG
jgi:uncharacterized protein Yka (UPF0111/DUF47 family)